MTVKSEIIKKEMGGRERNPPPWRDDGSGCGTEKAFPLTKKKRVQPRRKRCKEKKMIPRIKGAE